MNERILREYIEEVINEGGYFVDSEKSSDIKLPKFKKYIDKVVSFLRGSGASDKLAENWIEDKEMYFDVEVSDDLEKSVKDFARTKYKKFFLKSRNKEKTEKMVRKALDVKFYPKIRELEKLLKKLEDEDEDD